MKVLLVSLPGLRRGGIEEYVLQLLGGLQTRVDYHVAAFFFEGEFLQDLARRGLETPCHAFARSYHAGPGALRAVRRVIHRVRPDLVHTLEPRGRVVAGTVARAMGIPTIHTVHVAPIAHLVPPLRRWAYHAAEAYCGRILGQFTLFPSNAVQDLYRRRRLVRSGRFMVVRNGVPLEELRTRPPPGPIERARRREALGIPVDVPLLCTIGRLSKEKGFEDFLRAVAQIPPNRASRPAHGLIIGDGSQEPDLRRLARELGLEGRIHWAGWRPRAELADLLTLADVFVHPSRGETGSIPFTLLEAVAGGVPSVTTDVGDVRRFLGDEPGLRIVPPHDPEALAAAAAGMIESSGSDRTAPRPVDVARLADFSIERMLAGVLTAYRRALNGRAPPRLE